MKRPNLSHSLLIALLALSAQSAVAQVSNPEAKASTPAASAAPAKGAAAPAEKKAEPAPAAKTADAPAKTETTAAAPAKTEPAKSEPAKAEPAKAEADKTASAPAPVKTYKSEVTPEMFEKYKMGLAFNGPVLQLVSVDPLATACVTPGLQLEKIKNQPSEESVDAEGLTSREDLEKYSSKVGASYTYEGPEKSFDDCLIAHKDDESKTKLSGVSALSKNILKGKESAIAGLLDSENNVTFGKDPAQSATFLKYLKMLEATDCKNCSRKNMQELAKEVTNQPVLATPLMLGLIKKGVATQLAAIPNANKLRELEQSRDDLLSYVAMMNKMKLDPDQKQEISEQIIEALNKSQERVTALAFQDARHAPKYADFLYDSYAKLATVPGLPKEGREEALEKKASYAKGGFERTKFISLIDPHSEEVRASLSEGQAKMDELKYKRMVSCQYRGSNMEACGAAEQNLAQAQSSLDFAAQRFIEAQAMNKLLSAQPQIMMNPQGGTQVAGSQNANAANGGFNLNPSIFPNANLINTAGSTANVNANATQLYNANTVAYQPNNNNGLYNMERSSIVSVPLNQTNYQSNGFGTSTPINTGLSSGFSFGS